LAERKVAELNAAARRDYVCDHVLYEITHFVRGIEACRGQIKIPQNFAVEVMVIHMRNLVAFFYDSRPENGTELGASHFFGDPSAWNPPQQSTFLKRSRGRADKEIAHLTTGRKSNPSDKAWDQDRIAEELVPVIARFAADADLVCDEFATAVSERLKELQAGTGRRVKVATGMAGP
jgi:hypothetical protein